MKAAKTDLKKREDRDDHDLSEMRDLRTGSIVMMIACIFLVFVLLMLSSVRSAHAQLVPADDYIVAPTGTLSTANYFGFADGLGYSRQAMTVPTSTHDRAVCGIDAQVTNVWTLPDPGLHYVFMSVLRDSLSAPTLTANSRSIDAHDLPLATEYYNATSTWIFDPCVTLLAGRTYYVVSSVDPTFSSGIAVKMRMLQNTTTPGFLEYTYDPGIPSWRTWPQAGYPEDEAWLAVVYGFGTLSGIDQPVSSDYGFSTGSAIGTDLGTTGNFLSDVFKYLFVPSDSAANGYAINKASLLEKAPIGYFSLAKDAFLGLATSTASSTVLTLTTSLGAIEMWDTSSTEHSILWEGVSPWLFGIERLGMWMGFLFYLFVRARDLRI